jgi:hypothetical protein
VDEVDAIWNRSTKLFAHHANRDGDHHLRDVRQFDAGFREVGFVLDDPQHAPHVATAFEYFGLQGAADAINKALEVREQDSAVLEQPELPTARYEKSVPNQDVIKDALRRRLGDRPDDFAPVEPRDYFDEVLPMGEADEGMEEPEDEGVELNDASRVWNRACSDFEPQLPGDGALKAVLAFHGLVMNGGLEYAVDTDVEAAVPAVAGFRHLGADQLAEVVDRARVIVSRLGTSNDEVDVLDLSERELDELHQLDERYGELVPLDDALVKIFECHYSEHRAEYAPL